MSIFKKHIRTLRAEVKAYLSEYQKAQSAVEKAKADYEKSAEDTKVFIARHMNSPLEIVRHKNRTEQLFIIWQASKEELQKINDRRLDILNRVNEIREELKAEEEANYQADPAKVDTNTMFLINSGILRASDYEKLFADAKSAGNITMIRLIAQAAEKLADTEKDKNKRISLNILCDEARRCEHEEVDAFDEYASALKTGIGSEEYHREVNPAVVQYFLDVTADCED